MSLRVRGGYACEGGVNGGWRSCCWGGMFAYVLRHRKASAFLIHVDTCMATSRRENTT